MGLAEQVLATHSSRSRGRKASAWSQPSFWDTDLLRYPLIGNTSLGSNREQIENDFEGYVRAAYKRNGPIFSLMLVRMLVFAEARFQFRKMRNGRPGDLFGNADLAVLEKPWPGATTGDLLSRMIQDADLAGNAFVAKVGGRLRRLRPDWVTIVSASQSEPELFGAALDAEVIGYLYSPRSPGARTDTLLLPSQVAHFAPIPDPEMNWRGMSWLTPVLRELAADSAATTHKLKFFEHGATPNLVVRLDASVTPDMFKRFKALMDEQHGGVDNAYKCLHPDTDVAMWDGSRRLAGAVRAGDRVVAWSEGRAVPGVVAAAEEQPPSPIVTVTTQRGRVIKTNDRHPFLTRRVIKQGRRHLSGETWVDAADLRPGDLLTTGLGWATDDVEDAITPYEAWALGVIVGDGCTISTTPVVSAWDEGIRTRLRIGHTLNPTGKGHDYRVLGIRALCARAGVMGKRSREKRIPDQVMTGSAKVKAAFLSGLIDTDGHVTNPKGRRSAEVGITSTSRDLLADAQHLLASLGVNSSVSLSMPAGRQGGAERDAWRLHALGNTQARRLHEVLDLACAEKARRLAEYATVPSRDDRCRYDRVVSVEVGAEEPTIGLEIAEHHTHVTGGVVTHNTLYLGGGADVTVAGADLKQLDFKNTQGAGESRLAAAAGVPASIVGFSEGMQGSSLNAGNYQSSRRRFADGTMRPLWRNVAGSLSPLVTIPAKAELWYDDRDIAFLREDAADQAAIVKEQMLTVESGVRGGFEPTSVVAAVQAGDLGLMTHTGLYSVQLQPPGSVQPQPPPVEPPADPPPKPPAEE